jgi:hypothetical protein
MNFILLPRDRFIESWLPLGRETLTLLDRLNAAHSIDLLWWLVLSSGAAFA